MNYLNILPPRIRQLVYDFDGRYKTAKGKCLQIIKEMGEANKKIDDICHGFIIGVGRRSDLSVETYHSCWPNYYAEIQRRVVKYRELLIDGHIRGVTTHLKRAPKSHTFKDAVGSYYLATTYDTIFVGNVAYKSTTKLFTVVMEPYNLYMGPGTSTVVKRIDILNPDFIKSIKARGQKRTKIFRDLGVSENGIPGKDVYFESITIDGNDYFLENKVMTTGGFIRKTRSSSVLGHINARGVVKWFGDKR